VYKITFNSLTKTQFIHGAGGEKRKKKDQRLIPEVLRKCRGLPKCNLFGHVYLLRADGFPSTKVVVLQV